MAKFEPKPFGKYFLTDRIAVGGMAEIYKAKTFGVDGFEKMLAIKKILPHYSQDQNFVTMLTDEAKLVVHLSHPNIVQIYDLGRVGDDYFISMEYINGVNLRELIGRVGELGEKIPLPVCLFIAAEVCKGLDYAHSKRGADGQALEIVHRDISPHNILVSFEGEVKIVDFGIARAAMNASNTQFGTLKGKVTYMSPEQALGRPIDARTDIFSAGLVLYEMVTGCRLFHGETQLEVLEKIKNTRITENTLDKRVDTLLVPALTRALSYAPKNRFTTAADLQVALTRSLFAEYPDFTSRELAEYLARWFGRPNPEASFSQLTPSRWSQFSKMGESQQQVTLVRRDATAGGELETIKVGELRPEMLEEATEKTSGILPQKILPKRLWIYALAGLAALLLILIVAFSGTDEMAREPAARQNAVPEAVAVRTYSVMVLSKPAAADIFFNGAPTGKITPAGFSGLVVGQKYRVQLKKEGFEDYTEELTSQESRDQVLDVTLSNQPMAQLAVTSVPAGAGILMNGHPTGFVTPHDFTQLAFPQKVVVTLKMEGYKEASEVLTVEQSEPDRQLHFDLERIIQTYDVNIAANVEGARVMLNGRDYGLTPLATTLPEGKYTLIVSQSGYKNVIQTFVVRDHEKMISIVMEKEI